MIPAPSSASEAAALLLFTAAGALTNAAAPHPLW